MHSFSITFSESIKLFCVSSVNILLRISMLRDKRNESSSVEEGAFRDSRVSELERSELLFNIT